MGDVDTLVATETFSESCSQDSGDRTRVPSEESVPVIVFEGLNKNDFGNLDDDQIDHNHNYLSGSCQTYPKSQSEVNMVCSTPHRMGAIGQFLDQSMSSILTSTSSMSLRGSRVSSSKTSFSPRSRRNIIDIARSRSNPKKKEPVAFNVRLTTCSLNYSVADFSSCVWEIPICSKNSDSLQTNDKLLIKFQSGLCMEDGRKIDILEGHVIAYSNNKKIVIIEHERLNFSFTGGSVSTTVYVVKKAYYEKKYHCVQMSNFDNDFSVKLECTLRIVQGASQASQLEHVMKQINETLTRDSKILIIGECVRERTELSAQYCYLNLKNLRPSKEVVDLSGSTVNPEFEHHLREQHFELARKYREDLRELSQLCDEYLKTKDIVEMKSSKIQMIFATLNRLELGREILSEIDRRIMNEICSETNIIYGTVEDVQDSQTLLHHLRPAATIVLDSQTLTCDEITTVLAVRRSYVYFLTDTPFFWENSIDYKIRRAMKKGTPLKKRGTLSMSFVERLETFLNFEKVYVDFLSERKATENPELSLILSCFKHNPEVSLDKPGQNMILLKHSKKAVEAKILEAEMIAGLKRLFVLQGYHDSISFVVDDNLNETARDSALGDSDTQNESTLRRRKFQQYGQTFVALEGLKADALQNLYRLASYTRRTFIMIGNVKELKKNDVHVERLMNNFAAAGIIRCVYSVTCPRHNCDVIFGDIKNGPPETGCRELCEEVLECGHSCAQKCHPHDEQTFEESWVQCRQSCSRNLPCGHPCPYSCSTPCAERCPERIEARLTCGHIAVVFCWEREQKLDGTRCLKEKCQRHANKRLSCTTTASTTSGRKLLSKIFH